ncbi:serine/threonine-protein kinase AfsK [Streptomyces himastatinicus ATCC 53653]|uniref:Serine/threonine-protein kinase AfsK n=1 Tax=Streptomyces himastatinicus ATCC 53653 TaxID=457427 RepID=D9WPT5_9ACTN|nr:serine/threonine-protein kinase AfsK [Streptomyces himastatinicus ATCC 53653]
MRADAGPGGALAGGRGRRGAPVHPWRGSGPPGSEAVERAGRRGRSACDRLRYRLGRLQHPADDDQRRRGHARLYVARAGARLAQRDGRQRHLLARLHPDLRGHRARALPRREPGRDRVHAAARGAGPDRAAGRAAAADRVVHADGGRPAAVPGRFAVAAGPAPVRLERRRQRYGLGMAAGRRGRAHRAQAQRVATRWPAPRGPRPAPPGAAGAEARRPRRCRPSGRPHRPRTPLPRATGAAADGTGRRPERAAGSRWARAIRAAACGRPTRAARRRSAPSAPGGMPRRPRLPRPLRLLRRLRRLRRRVHRLPPPPPLSTGVDGPVRLHNSQVAIGPGLRAADARDPQQRHDSGPTTGWVRPPGGLTTGGGSGGEAAVPPPSHSPATDAAEPPGAAGHGRWRPWRFRMSNDVWGTPAVAGDLLYVTSFEVHALDVGTGRRQFKTRDVAWAMAVEGGRIHASDGPTLYALDAADGSERWRLSTDGWVYSLKVDRGTVVTGTRGGGVQAWEAANGELLWEMQGVQTDFETPESGPVVHDGTVFVWQDARLRALEARTGVERWSYPVGDTASCGGVPLRLLPAPDGIVYVSAGTRVLAIDIARGEVRWRFEAPAVFLSPPAYAPGPAVTGGGIYVSDYLGTVYALDAANGRDRWRIATEARGSIEPVLVADGSVHLGSGSALYTLDAVTGTPKWRFAAGGEVIGSPVVADGRVHFGSADHCLYTVDAAGGQLRWKLATGGEITGSPVAAGGVVYACSKDRCVYALDAVKGTGQSRPSARA